MKIRINKRIIYTFQIVSIFIFLALSILALKIDVSAQLQGDAFSAQEADNYQCFENDSDTPTAPVRKGSDGYYYCQDGSRAVFKPPKLQQLEIWFVRVVYALWALIGSLSFLYLVLLGYRYMITRGDVTKITEIRQKIIYYIIGFALVFLAVPILSTVFRVMGINKDVDCYDVSMPGFQFFFTDLCTASADEVAEKCSVAPGTACSIVGQRVTCRDGAEIYTYICNSNAVWELR